MWLNDSYGIDPAGPLYALHSYRDNMAGTPSPTWILERANATSQPPAAAEAPAAQSGGSSTPVGAIVGGVVGALGEATTADHGIGWLVGRCQAPTLPCLQVKPHAASSSIPPALPCLQPFWLCWRSWPSGPARAGCAAGAAS